MPNAAEYYRLVQAPRSSKLRASVALVALSLGVAGCTPTVDAVNRGFARLGSGSFASQTADPACYVDRGKVAEFEEYFDKTLVAATFGGAIVGGIAGAAAGGGDIGSILAGAAIGGTAALAGTYISKLQGGGAYQALQTALTDVRTENQRVDQFNAALRALKNCRLAEARQIRTEFLDGAMSKEAAEAQMAAVRTRHDQDIAQGRKVADSISARTDQYVMAYNTIAADNGYRGLEVIAPQPRQRTRSVRVASAPKATPANDEANSFAMDSAERNDIAELQEECITNVQKRDDCFETLAEAEDAANGGAFTL
ncbi:MAG: hypothetical protein AAFX81_13850 [Pseudomonadota bacterium]